VTLGIVTLPISGLRPLVGPTSGVERLVNPVGRTAFRELLVVTVVCAPRPRCVGHLGSTNTCGKCWRLDRFCSLTPMHSLSGLLFALSRTGTVSGAEPKRCDDAAVHSWNARSAPVDRQVRFIAGLSGTLSWRCSSWSTRCRLRRLPSRRSPRLARRRWFGWWLGRWLR
jgi:hypothetical protein